LDRAGDDAKADEDEDDVGMEEQADGDEDEIILAKVTNSCPSTYTLHWT